MEQSTTFIYLLHPTRPGFVEERLPEEEAAMQAHVAYQFQLAQQGASHLFGPCLDRAFGLLIFDAESEEAARQIMEHDPAIARGIMRAELHPFQIAFARRDTASH